MCKHDDGCNAPEGECSGACMTQQVSTVDSQQILVQLLTRMHYAPAFALAVAELLTRADHLVWTKCQKQESQLAELRQGGEAVAEVVRNSSGQIYMIGSNGDVFDMSMFIDTKLYTRPQPAIPPGYAVVPVDPTRAMQDAWDTAGQHEDLDEEFAKAYRAMLSAAPSVPVAEKDAKDAARYRWLKESNNTKHNTFAMTLSHNYYGFEWDEKIDAAMLAAPADSKEDSDNA